MNDKIKEWLAGPTGVLVVRIVATIIKSALVFLSAKIPALGIGKDIDALVQELAPMATLALVVWWTTRQHKGEVKRTDVAVVAGKVAVIQDIAASVTMTPTQAAQLVANMPIADIPLQPPKGTSDNLP